VLLRRGGLGRRVAIGGEEVPAPLPGRLARRGRAPHEDPELFADAVGGQGHLRRSLPLGLSQRGVHRRGSGLACSGSVLRPLAGATSSARVSRHRQASLARHGDFSGSLLHSPGERRDARGGARRGGRCEIGPAVAAVG
ncbi:unnamed protein product, partial [Symbiodinium sp. CCMP2456]